MSKKVLRKVRDELVDIQTNDLFAAEAIKRCVALCDLGLMPGNLPPHQIHSDTSVAAAEAIAPKFGNMTRSVLRFLSRYPHGLIDEEAQRIMGMDGNSYRPCRVTLADKGLVKDTGIRRETSHKRPAVVWVITDKGLMYLNQ